MTSDANRQALIADFLRGAGWDHATVVWFDQDASTRRYARLTQASGETALLMDAPRIEEDPCQPGMSLEQRQRLGWNAMTRLAASRVDAFVLIAEHLKTSGLRPPEVFAYDAALGFALIEDFGVDREFARLIEKGMAELPLYQQAAEDLAHLHKQPTPSILRRGDDYWPILEFDAIALRANADLFADWYSIYDDTARMEDTDRKIWEGALNQLIAHAMSFPREFTLRDYHAENLLWLPEGRIGLLDFQDAVIGWDAWDIAMLTQDARRAVTSEASQTAVRAYLDATGKTAEAFEERLAIIGTLNALRIAGVFARLIKRDKKRRYAQFMPRQIQILARNLSHPAAAEMRSFIAATSPAILETLE